MEQVGLQPDPSDATPCPDAGARMSHINRTTGSVFVAPRIQIDADVPKIFQSSTANTVVQAQPSLVYMDEENIDDADNCLTPSTRCSSVVSLSKTSGEEAAKAAAAAALSASLARQQCAGLAEYLEERRAEAENQRLASMHAREKFRCAQLAQHARRDDRSPWILVEQVHFSANVKEDRQAPPSSGQSLVELDLSRKLGPLKPDLVEACRCTTLGCSRPFWNRKTDDLCRKSCGVSAGRCHGEDWDPDFYEAESNASTTDEEKPPDDPVAAEREDLCCGVDQFADAATSGVLPESPMILDMGPICGPLLVDLDVPSIEGERSLLRSLSAERFDKCRQIGQALLSL